MFHSSGLCRKAIMLPRQTINVFLSWFLLHRVTWGVLVENLCPPESLESASLHPGVLNTLCLLMWSGLKCVQSLWLWECKKKKKCLHVFVSVLCLACSVFIRTYTKLSIRHHCLGAYPYVFMFTSPFYSAIRFFLCIRECVCLCVHGYMSVQQVFNKGKMFALLSTLTA